jgi:hypothetical protein
MNWTQIIPIAVAAFTVIGGLFTYLFQKRKDRLEDLIKTRRSEYRKWVQALYDALSEADPTSAAKFNQTTNDLFLFASDAVMKAVGDFKHYLALTSRGGSPRDMHVVGTLLARVIREMRNDCFEATKLTEAEIRNILPIEGVRDDGT